MSDSESDVEALVKKNVEEKNAFLASLMNNNDFKDTMKGLTAVTNSKKTKRKYKKREKLEKKEDTEVITKRSARLEEKAFLASLRKTILASLKKNKEDALKAFNAVTNSKKNQKREKSEKEVTEVIMRHSARIQNKKCPNYADDSSTDED